MHATLPATWRLPEGRAMVVPAIALGLAAGLIAFTFTRSWTVTDGDAYWNAAMRLREGLTFLPHSLAMTPTRIVRRGCGSVRRCGTNRGEAIVRPRVVAETHGPARVADQLLRLYAAVTESR